jgi:hypothetical protein
MEALTAASNIRSIRYIVQDIWVCIEHGINEANWTLANSEAFLIDLFVSARMAEVALALASCRIDGRTKVKTDANNGDAKLLP